MTSNSLNTVNMKKVMQGDGARNERTSAVLTHPHTKRDVLPRLVRAKNLFEHIEHLREHEGNISIY